ncbi:MAG: hypothetical protein QM726_02350 [Chitinophagaceae bacterium]
MINGYVVIAVAALMLVFLLYKEWIRKNKFYLYWRLIASAIAVVMLGLMAYPFAKTEKTTVSNAVILTEGFQPDSVAAFLQQNNNQLYSIDRPVTIGGKNSFSLTNMRSFAVAHAQDTFHVFGNGFSNEVINMLGNHPIVFHASPLSSAFTNIYWKQNIVTGDPLLVQGNYVNNRRQTIKIILQAFGQNKDSVLIESGKKEIFQLQVKPLHTGYAVYSLIALAGKDTLEQNPLPLNVQSSSPLKLLMLAASPDFDNTYLKNQLTQQDYKVSINTVVSTNKTNRQYINLPSQTTNAITQKYLEGFDVVIADQETLQKMGAAELSAIRSAITDKGLGLIIKLEDNNVKQSFYARYFPLKALQKDKTSMVALYNAEDSSQFKLTITEPLIIEHVAGNQTILQDAQANNYAAVVLYGSGKIMGTSFGNTYSMALAGDAVAYRNLWSLLLDKVAKKKINDTNWRTYPQFSFVNHPVQLQTETNSVLAPAVVANNALVYFKQNSLLPFSYNGTYWPVEPGWQQLPQTDSVAAAWYAYKKTDWSSLMAYHRNQATARYAALHPVQYSNGVLTGFEQKGNKQLWLFLLFIIACAFLWVEQKIG